MAFFTVDTVNAIIWWFLFKHSLLWYFSVVCCRGIRCTNTCAFTSLKILSCSALYVGYQNFSLALIVYWTCPSDVALVPQCSDCCSIPNSELVFPLLRTISQLAFTVTQYFSTQVTVPVLFLFGFVVDFTLSPTFTSGSCSSLLELYTPSLASLAARSTRILFCPRMSCPVGNPTRNPRFNCKCN